MSPQSPSLTDENFNHQVFTEKFGNGWLKYYFYAVIIFFFVSFAHFIRTLELSVSYLTNPITKDADASDEVESYHTLLYGLSLLTLAGLAIFLLLGLFIQYQAFRLKSVVKQCSCLKIMALFTIAQAGASIFHILCGVITEPISLLSTTLTGIIPFVIGMSFTFFASKVLDIVLGPELEPFQFDEKPLEIELHMI